MGPSAALKADGPDGSFKLSKPWELCPADARCFTSLQNPDNLHQCPISSLTFQCPLLLKQHNFGSRSTPHLTEPNVPLRKFWHSSTGLSSLWLLLQTKCNHSARSTLYKQNTAPLVCLELEFSVLFRIFSTTFLPFDDCSPKLHPCNMLSPLMNEKISSGNS